MSLRWRPSGPYLLAGLGVVLALVVLGFIALSIPAGGRTQLLIEVAKASMGIVPLAFFGVVGAEMVRRRDLDKARREQERAARASFRSRVIDAYHRAKATRRILRAAGLRSDSSKAIDESRLVLLDEQMHALIAAQLGLEELKREVQADSAPFEQRGRIEAQLELLEREMNAVVRDWENGRPDLQAPVRPNEVFSQWQSYSKFVAPRPDGMQTGMSATFRELDGLLIDEIAAARSGGSK